MRKDPRATVDAEKKRAGMRVEIKKKSDGVRVHHEKEG